MLGKASVSTSTAAKAIVAGAKILKMAKAHKKEVLAAVVAVAGGSLGTTVVASKKLLIRYCKIAP